MRKRLLPRTLFAAAEPEPASPARLGKRYRQQTLFGAEASGKPPRKRRAVDERFRKLSAEEKAAAARAMQDLRELSVEKFKEVPDKRYKVIVLDPPWLYTGIPIVEPDYPRFLGRDLGEMFDVAAKASPEFCLMLMWTTGPMMKQAIELVERWGFEFATVFTVWKKLTSGGKDATNPGYYTNPSCEFVLAATRRGTGKLRDIAKLKERPGQFVESKRGRHSEKPMQFFDQVYAYLNLNKRDLLTSRPYPMLEMFARDAKPGFDTFGNNEGRWFQPASCAASDAPRNHSGKPPPAEKPAQ